MLLLIKDRYTALNSANITIRIYKALFHQDHSAHDFGTFCCHSRNTGASPFSFTISVLGSFTCITQHTWPTALHPIRRTKQLWLSVLLKDTSAVTGQAGIRTHILTTPELESNALYRSATTLIIMMGLNAVRIRKFIQPMDSHVHVIIGNHSIVTHVTIPLTLSGSLLQDITPCFQWTQFLQTIRRGLLLLGKNYINQENVTRVTAKELKNLTFWYAINHKWPISESFKFWITLFESTIVALKLF